ncbi:hypothetical protein FRX31_010176 [Thalictrum thalictroides]|uniref:Uncharacterized protein n=1 Tax=Thalictrum thalictroides TaxID=46969 RepID=A0A7J6WTF9_THATH|nr:hypothetical protein FRX31_010176 [Thalictrum thalictroides]
MIEDKKILSQDVFIVATNGSTRILHGLTFISLLDRLQLDALGSGIVQQVQSTLKAQTTILFFGRQSFNSIWFEKPMKIGMDCSFDEQPRE